MGVCSAFVVVAFVAVTASSAAGEPTVAQPPDSECQEICKHDGGLDSHIDSCLTACTARTEFDHDGKFDRHKFLAAGEDTRIENAADSFADPSTQGDDKYTPFTPTFKDWDLNKNGVLEEAEVFNAFMYEFSKQDAVDLDFSAAQPSKKEVVHEWEEDFERAWPQIDRNGDGVVSREEFEEDPIHDLGQEPVESTVADEHAADPDSGEFPAPSAAVPAHAAPVLLRGRHVSQRSRDGSPVSGFRRERGQRFAHHGRHAASVQHHASAAPKR